MSSLPPKTYLQEEEAFLSPECRALISTLPKEKGLIAFDVSHLYQYQGFWYTAPIIEGMISCQKQMDVQHSDIFLVNIPKSGTTWLISIMFTLLNRKRYDPAVVDNHPLVTHNPHHLVPIMEMDLYKIPAADDILSSPRLFATHLPYTSFPEPAKSKSCKIVYLCRNPKDTFVSLWHFVNKVMPALKMGRMFSIEEALDMFCKGVASFGPYWDHVLQYWKLSQENPSRVLFLKYEDMKEKPGLHLRRLAEFLDCHFSEDEEESGMVDQILKLCSFDHLSSLKVNKEDSTHGLKSNAFFRKGEVGDWKNHLTAEMAHKIDQITQHKFRGSGLELC